MKLKLLKPFSVLASLFCAQFAFSSEPTSLTNIKGYVTCAVKEINKGDIKVTRAFDTVRFDLATEDGKLNKIPLINGAYCLATVQEVTAKVNSVAIKLNNFDNKYALKMNFLPDGSLSESDSIGIYKDRANKIYYLSAVRSKGAESIALTLSEDPIVTKIILE